MTDQRLFPELSAETRKAFETLERAVEEAAPLTSGMRRVLPDKIREVWRSLTSDREDRDSLYLARPEYASAYLRYFFPWNMFRFARLFSALEFSLGDGSVIIDIGSGPLTVITALWITRPELRDKKITVYAVDRAGASLEAGTAVLERIAVDISGKPPVWTIIRVKERFGASIRQKADLVTAAFVMNELSQRNRKNFAEQAESYFHTLKGYAHPYGRLLMLEPGVPRSGALIAAIRDQVIDRDGRIIAPCTHEDDCPMPGPYAPDSGKDTPSVRSFGGKRTPWCHFTFGSEGAPLWLKAISKEAKLDKEEAAVSFVYAGFTKLTDSEKKKEIVKGKDIDPIRVISNAFALPDGYDGRYVCSERGYSLLKAARGSDIQPGDYREAKLSPTAERDAKTGALVVFDQLPVPGSPRIQVKLPGKTDRRRTYGYESGAGTRKPPKKRRHDS